MHLRYSYFLLSSLWNPFKRFCLKQFNKNCSINSHHPNFNIKGFSFFFLSSLMTNCFCLSWHFVQISLNSSLKNKLWPSFYSCWLLSYYVCCYYLDHISPAISCGLICCNINGDWKLFKKASNCSLEIPLLHFCFRLTLCYHCTNIEVF